MKSTLFKSTVLALIVSNPLSVIAAEPLSKSEGITNPIEAIVQIPVTGVRVAMGVTALPLLFVGEVGSLTGQAGEALWEQANRPNSASMQDADTKTYK